MGYQLRVKPIVEKELKKIPKKDYYRILSAFTILSRDPFIGKKMEGKYKDYHNYRVWPYRIIYQIRKHERMVLVVRIGQRQGIY